jgi:hypothetical protein
MALHVTMQYRAHLRAASRNEAWEHLQYLGLPPDESDIEAARKETEELEGETDRSAAELLKVLQGTPLSVLGMSQLISPRLETRGAEALVAANGDSTVEKTRYVAVAQLQALEDLSARLVILPDEVGEEVGRDLLRLESAQSYLRESPENLLVRMVKARTDECRELSEDLGRFGSLILPARCMSPY